MLTGTQAYRLLRVAWHELGVRVISRYGVTPTRTEIYGHVANFFWWSAEAIGVITGLANPTNSTRLPDE